MPDISDLFVRCKDLLQSGHQSNAIVQYLHDNNVRMIDAVKTIRTLYSVGLAEADFMVRSHPAWKTEAIVSNSLTEAFVKLVEEASRVRMITDRFRVEGIGLGNVGSIIEQFNDGAYKIEFSDEQGTPYAQIIAHPYEFEPCDPPGEDHT